MNQTMEEITSHINNRNVSSVNLLQEITPTTPISDSSTGGRNIINGRMTIHTSRINRHSTITTTIHIIMIGLTQQPSPINFARQKNSGQTSMTEEVGEGDVVAVATGTTIQATITTTTITVGWAAECIIDQHHRRLEDRSKWEGQRSEDQKTVYLLG